MVAFGLKWNPDTWEGSLLRRWWSDYAVRWGGLYVFTGLAVSWVRHGIQYHWKPFSSWEEFFASWFVHCLGVGVLVVVTVTAILWTHKFFLGRHLELKQGDELVFYIVMTVLVAALAVALMANVQPSDDHDSSLPPGWRVAMLHRNLDHGGVLYLVA